MILGKGTSSSRMIHRHPMSRRDLFRGASLVAAAGLLRGSVPSWAAPVPALSFGSDLYQSIGVRPLINCKGTFTILSGSLTPPEVKTAMLEASKHFVHIDELMEGVGKRLAELTGAESGIVTCGCAAALTHATAAAIAGGDSEKINRLPDLTGLRNEVIAPRYSRNVYDHAIRMLGTKIVEVESEDGLHARRHQPPHRHGHGARQPGGYRAFRIEAGGRHRPAAPSAGARRRRRRGSQHSQCALGTGHRPGRVQRRQSVARTPERRPAAGPQGRIWCKPRGSTVPPTTRSAVP